MSTVTLQTDARKLIDYLKGEGVTKADAVTPGWDHMGGLIVDAVLQANRGYETIVRPRVENIIAEYPEAGTVSGFLALAEQVDLRDVTNYRSVGRTRCMREIAETFQSLGIETVEDLRSRLQGSYEDRHRARDALFVIRGVGQKTVDYFDLLVGNPDGLAIDIRVRRVLTSAGVERLDYEHCARVVRAAAEELDWPANGLDAVLWRIGDSFDES